MIATYHNHSTWSDGKDSVATLVDWAADHDVDEIGVSDHLVLRPDGTLPKWSLEPARVGDYIADVLAQRRADGPTVRLGLEVDWYPGHADLIRDGLDGLPLDYVLGSVHEIGPFVLDGSPASWDKLDAAGQDEMHRRYWIHMRSLAESGLFDIAAHIDLNKKFGHRPTIDLSAEIDAALDAIAAAGVIVELNTAGWHKPCGDAYPSIGLLEACCRRGIGVTLSADAHQSGHLLRDFDRGAARLADAGFTRLARFAGRQVTYDRIEQCIPEHESHE
ncbi:MAG: histidinol-phosphatase HisJ family protein [Planctomycetes bacterium]|nr:histidinol-phosphatase HisJ family protein [Planctomycetota bacterium]